MKIYLWDYLLFRAGLKRKNIAQRETNQSLKNIVELLQIERSQHTASIRNLKADVEALTDGLNALKPDVALAHEADLLDQITALKEELRLALDREKDLRQSLRLSASNLHNNAGRITTRNVVRTDVPTSHSGAIPSQRPVESGHSGVDLSTLALVAVMAADDSPRYSEPAAPVCEPSRSSSWGDSSPSSSYGSGDSGSSDGGGGGGE